MCRVWRVSRDHARGQRLPALRLLALLAERSDDVRQPPPPTLEYQGRTYQLPQGNPYTVLRNAQEWAADQMREGKLVLAPGQRIEFKVYRANDNPGEHKA